MKRALFPGKKLPKNGAESDTRRQRGNEKEREKKRRKERKEEEGDGASVESVENGVSVRTVKLKNGPSVWLVNSKEVSGVSSAIRLGPSRASS